MKLEFANSYLKSILLCWSETVVATVQPAV